MESMCHLVHVSLLSSIDLSVQLLVPLGGCSRVVTTILGIGSRADGGKWQVSTAAWMACGSKRRIKISLWTTIIFNSIVFKMKMKNRHNTWEILMLIQNRKKNIENSRKQAFYLPPAFADHPIIPRDEVPSSDLHI